LTKFYANASLPFEARKVNTVFRIPTHIRQIAIATANIGLGFISLATIVAGNNFQAGAATIGSDPTAEVVSMDNSDCRGFDMHVNGRNILLSPGSCTTTEKTIEVPQQTLLLVPPCATLQIADEDFVLTTAGPNHPFYKRMPAACLAGSAGMGPVPRRMVAGTLKVFKVTDGSPTGAYVEGIDYAVDPQWGSIERLPAGSAAEGEKVRLQYHVYRSRLDSIALTKDGTVQLITGYPTQFAPSPPKTPEGALVLAHVLAPPLSRKLAASAIMPVYRWESAGDPILDEMNARALAKTREKLQSGAPLRIAFCGDSVTQGCFASSPQKSFVHVFMDKLKARYPQTTVQFVNYSVPGATSSIVFPRFVAEILPHHPDLIVVEFVNDISLDNQTIADNYQSFFTKARAFGADVIVCLPHLPAPSFAGVRSWSAVSGKPYFTMMQKLAENNNIGLANVGRRWENAPNEGLNPLLLLADQANHPNDRGHEMYAEELLSCLTNGKITKRVAATTIELQPRINHLPLSKISSR
jgi:lysophospholipase L1-like esterase